jgi:ribonuclease Z
MLMHRFVLYDIQEIQQAVSALPPPLAGRTFALTEGF